MAQAATPAFTPRTGIATHIVGQLLAAPVEQRPPLVAGKVATAPAAMPPVYPQYEWYPAATGRLGRPRCGTASSPRRRDAQRSFGADTHAAPEVGGNQFLSPGYWPTSPTETLGALDADAAPATGVECPLPLPGSPATGWKGYGTSPPLPSPRSEESPGRGLRDPPIALTLTSTAPKYPQRRRPPRIGWLTFVPSADGHGVRVHGQLTVNSKKGPASPTEKPTLYLRKHCRADRI
jgi:hypothetical protein